MRILLMLAAVMCHRVTSSDAAQPTKSVEIPLDRVWAYRMPNTRDITELEPSAIGMRYGPLTDEIRYALGTKRFRERLKNRKIIGYEETPFGRQPRYSVPPLEPVGEGFAVAGDNPLREAHAVLVKNAKRPEVLTGPVTLVFFSVLAGSYVHLDRIDLSGSSITLTYRLQGHTERESLVHHLFCKREALPSS